MAFLSVLNRSLKRKVEVNNINALKWIKLDEIEILIKMAEHGQLISLRSSTIDKNQQAVNCPPKN